MQENAVVYARYSSHNQTENSIEGQVAAAEAYAASHGYTITHVYADRAKTGTNDQREEFQRMLADTKKHQFSVIIVWKVDRFGRNREEITFNKYKCKKEGIRVEYVAEQLGEGNESVILESVLEGMAEYYSKQLAENVKRGKKAAKDQGRWQGGNRTYGYDVVDHKFVINESEAKAVRTIFDRFADGAAITEISRETGIPDYTVTRILANERYAGTVISPSIVPRSLWEAVQKRKGINISRRTSKAENEQNYPLTSRLYCSCGEHMSGTGVNYKGTRYRYYACYGHLHKSGCPVKYLNAKVVESAVLEGLRDALSDPEVVNKIVEGVMEEYKEFKSQIQIDKKVDKEIKALDKKIENILRAVESGMEFADVKDRLEELKTARQALVDEVAKVKHDDSVVVDERVVRTYLEGFSLRGDRRTIVERYIDRVTYGNGGFDIRLNICPDFRINKLMPGRVRVKAKKFRTCKKKI